MTGDLSALFCLVITLPACPFVLPAGQLRIMPLLQHRMLLLGFKEQPQVRTCNQQVGRSTALRTYSHVL
jgi:hypothetical protein